jgi:hypothetical protein
MTHGTETFSGRYHEKNTEYSYARHVADHLEVEHKNVAFPGASNEMIFHRTITELYNPDITHCLIGWTADGREAFERGPRHWTFNLGHGTYTNTDIDNNDKFSKSSNEHASFHADEEEFLKGVEDYWGAMIVKFVNEDYNSKLKHYRDLIKTVCKLKNVHLVEIRALVSSQATQELMKLPVGEWVEEGRHPNKEEHKELAELVIKEHYA